MAGAVAVKGLADLNRAFARADKQVKRDVRIIMRGVAEPVRQTAESLALSEISGIGKAKRPKWQGMRIGVTRTLVYVAPTQRGRLTKQNKRRYARPNMGDLLMRKAMEPALERHEHEFEAALGNALDRMATRWGAGG